MFYNEHFFKWNTTSKHGYLFCVKWTNKIVKIFRFFKSWIFFQAEYNIKVCLNLCCIIKKELDSLVSKIVKTHTRKIVFDSSNKKKALTGGCSGLNDGGCISSCSFSSSRSREWSRDLDLLRLFLSLCRLRRLSLVTEMKINNRKINDFKKVTFTKLSSKNEFSLTPLQVFYRKDKHPVSVL